MDAKPGWQTTEFWLTLVVVLGVFVLIALGRLDVPSAISLAGAALGAAGYSHSRALAKTDGGAP